MASPSVPPPTSPVDIWKCLKTFLAVTAGQGLLLASCAERPGLRITANHPAMCRAAFSQQKRSLSSAKFEEPYSWMLWKLVENLGKIENLAKQSPASRVHREFGPVASSTHISAPLAHVSGRTGLRCH